MSSSIKPRYKHSDQHDIAASLISDDKVEKDAKIREKECRQLRFLILVITIITVSSGYAGMKHRRNKRLKGLKGGLGTVKLVNPNDMALIPEAAKELNISEIELIESKLVDKVKQLDMSVREYKSKPGILMEVDPKGMQLTKELQHWTHKLLVQRYGHHTFRVVLYLKFPENIPDFKEKGPNGKVVIQLAPIDLLPCSVFMFLEIARTWRSGAFHRNAGHVLQAVAHSEVKKSMPFQEYSPEHPHIVGSSGYAGRPSGPGFYISIKDNTYNHGPGSQQHHNKFEADANFGNVVEGMEDVVPRIHSIPETGWLSKENQIKIERMTILYKDTSHTANEKNEAGDEQWMPWSKDTPSVIAQS